MMDKSNFHNVGERFEMCGLVYEVVECCSCDGCSLFIHEDEVDICVDSNVGRFESCCGLVRPDEKDVIFVNVVDVV